MNRIEFQELMDIVEVEHLLEIQNATAVIKNLLQNNDIETDDYKIYSSYDLSLRKKLREIARLFCRDDLTIYGDSDDYHNLAIDYVKLHMHSSACLIIERGLRQYPYSVDLLADQIQYGADSGILKLSADAFQKLTNIEKCRWNWRAYTFGINYILECSKCVQGEDWKKLRSKAFKLADEFIAYSLKHEEHIDQAYFTLSMLLSTFDRRKKGNLIETEETTLIKGCNSTKAAPRCALRLADIYFERGEYNESIKYLKRCFEAANKPQPDINGSYVYLLRAMSNTSKLFNEIQGRDFTDKEDEIKGIYTDFNTALADKTFNPVYVDAAKSTIRILETQSGKKNEILSYSDEFI